MIQRNFYRNVSDSLKRQVWAKGQYIPGFHRDVWRRDTCGHIILYHEYANTHSRYGWEIDHIIPVVRGGTDLISNLQPLYWENNRLKGDRYPWYCENAA
jgi:5-methylcytosine-specific restriction endonuclease McrA